MCVGCRRRKHFVYLLVGVARVEPLGQGRIIGPGFYDTLLRKAAFECLFVCVCMFARKAIFKDFTSATSLGSLSPHEWAVCSRVHTLGVVLEIQERSAAERCRR